VIVLDLDETIGSFGELFILWNNAISDKTQSQFNTLMDLYPEFLRYGILNIIDYLKYKKESGYYLKTYIYTNNVLPKYWVQMIVKYIECKQSCVGLFDKIIHGFNKSFDCNRTTSNKTHSDFIRCSVLPRSTEICFIDDTYFERMERPAVYYIQPKQYYHSMKTSDIVERFSNSKFVTLIDKLDVRDFLHQTFIKNGMLNTTGKSRAEVDMDILVSQKIMYYLKEFFIMATRKNKTRKVRQQLGRFTRKRL
jgi:hypothetical protein